MRGPSNPDGSFALYGSSAPGGYSGGGGSLYVRHFIRNVRDLVSTGALDATAGQQLIDAANQIILTLGG